MYLTSDMKLSILEMERKGIFFDVETKFKKC
jgi:hypothetical protein